MPEVIVPQLLTQAAACRYLGLTAWVFRQLRARGELPKPVKISKKSLWWRKSDLDKWLARLPADSQLRPVPGARE